MLPARRATADPSGPLLPPILAVLRRVRCAKKERGAIIESLTQAQRIGTAGAGADHLADNDPGDIPTIYQDQLKYMQAAEKFRLIVR